MTNFLLAPCWELYRTSKLSVPKVPEPDRAATLVCAKNKKGPKPGEHVQLFCMKGFSSQKCKLCIEWAGYLVPRDVLPPFHKIVAHTEGCVQRTLLFGPYFCRMKLFVGHRGGGVQTFANFFIKKHLWIVFRFVLACHTTTPDAFRTIVLKKHCQRTSKLTSRVLKTNTYRACTERSFFYPCQKQGFVRLAHISQFLVLCLLSMPPMPSSFVFWGFWWLLKFLGT